MRMLHTMLRIGDMDRSIEFYTKVMGMKLLRKEDYPEHQFSLAFVGYAEESETAVIELTHNWDTDSYDLGSGYGHVAIGVKDVYETCDKIKAAGGNVIRDAGPMQGGTTVIAFVEDPDGYKVELLEDF